MKTIESYPARITPDEDGRFLVSFPDLPEALTDGANHEEAVAEAMDCLEEAIAGRINRSETIPSPSKKTTRMESIYLSSQFVLKLLLHRAFQDAKIAQTELAERIGVNEKEIRRMLDPHYGSKLPNMEKALKALGWNIHIGLGKTA